MNSLQKIVDKHSVAEKGAEQLIKAFGAPFTEVGEILADYPRDELGEFIITDRTIVVIDESDEKSMKKARELRLELKKARTTVENKRKELKEESLRTGKAIDSVAKYIKDTIQPVEEYLERQEKFAELQAEKRRMELKRERTDKISPYTDNPFEYPLDSMTDEAFEKLFSELKSAHELKQAQAEAYEREQARIREEKEKEDARIREENEILKRQAAEREAEIAKQQEEAEVIQQAQVAAVRTEAEKKVLSDIMIKVNALERITAPDKNGGRPLVDYSSVVQLLEG